MGGSGEASCVWLTMHNSPNPRLFAPNLPAHVSQQHVSEQAGKHSTKRGAVWIQERSTLQQEFDNTSPPAGGARRSPRPGAAADLRQSLWTMLWRLKDFEHRLSAWRVSRSSSNLLVARFKALLPLVLPSDI